MKFTFVCGLFTTVVGFHLPRPPLPSRVRVAPRLSEAMPAELRAPAGATDWAQIAKYPAATIAQLALVSTCLKAVDAVGPVPGFAVPPLFLFLSLRSRVFSPMSAKRPDRGAQDGAATPREVKRPAWTPPGIAFPFIWITISLLRATSSLFVWRATGRMLCSPPLLALVAHLCVGDTWNCVTNVERRLGTSALGVLGVLGSVYYAVWWFAAVCPLAGKLLAPSAVWITIATVLTWNIWTLNEPREPLLPKVADGKSSSLRMPLVEEVKALLQKAS